MKRALSTSLTVGWKILLFAEKGGTSARKSVFTTRGLSRMRTCVGTSGLHIVTKCIFSVHSTLLSQGGRLQPPRPRRIQLRRLQPVFPYTPQILDSAHRDPTPRSRASTHQAPSDWMGGTSKCKVLETEKSLLESRDLNPPRWTRPLIKGSATKKQKA